jgi:hypothetical protein
MFIGGCRVQCRAKRRASLQSPRREHQRVRNPADRCGVEIFLSVSGNARNASTPTRSWIEDLRVGQSRVVLACDLTMQLGGVTDKELSIVGRVRGEKRLRRSG